nr:protein SPEAR3-like [Oryza sativa Japonica Group]
MMHAGGAGGNRDDGSSDPWKRKGDKKKKKDDKPKERKRGFGVAKLEIIRIQSELAEQKRKNELAEQEKRQNAQQGPPQIPDGTTDGLDIAAIRGSVYPWSMHANVAPSLPPPAHYSPHLAMHYGSEGMGAMNFGQSQSTPLRFPGASGPYPAPNNIRHVSYD